MLNEVKLLVFDLDGTLLNSDKNITIETKKEIQRVAKFTALEEIKSILGLNSNQVAVFGDYDNDLSMFACSNHCIAMKNGSELVKKSANYITEYTNDEDGVAIFIRKNIMGDTQKS